MNCSIIVPVYNHWHLVPKLLECLARQTLPQTEFETILIDNGSDDFRPPDKLPANVTVRTCKTPGSYAARNHGIAHARAPWLVFTDADCRPKPDWLENLMAAANQPTENSRSGPQSSMSCRSDLQIANKPQTETPLSGSHKNDKTTKRQNDKTIYAGAVQMIPSTQTPNRYEIYDLVRGIPQEWYIRRGYAATANLAVPAALLKKLNGFDPTRLSGGDAEFCRRALAAGAVLEYIPGAAVEHPARTSWKELVAKVRRVKHGQVAAGSRSARWRWRLRTLLPPIVECWKYLFSRPWPASYRLQAIAVQFLLWPVEIHETWRLFKVRSS